MALEQSGEQAGEAVEWLPARLALALIVNFFENEDDAKAAIIRRVCCGLIRTKAAVFSGYVEPEPQQLQRVEGRNTEIPNGFWGADWHFSAFNWNTGDVLIDGPPVLGVEFAKPDIIRIVGNALNPTEVKTNQASRRGRPVASWWPDFAEELAVYIHDNGVPKGSDAEGQSKMIDKIFAALADRGREEPSRTSIQDVVSAVLRRIRSAGN